MKKLLTLLIGLCMIMSVMASFSMPHPVGGIITLDGDPLKYAEIEVTNLDTGNSGKTTTDSNGFYQVELGNVDPTYSEGDTIKVTIVYCGNINYCNTIDTISGGGNRIDMNIEKTNTPEVPDDVVVVKYICWDGSGVERSSDCPVQPRDIECADGSIVQEPEDCPEENNSWLYWLFSALGAIVAGAGFWRFGGKYILMHNHRGIKGYHNPQTSHRNPKYRHAKFWAHPVQCIKDIKKIEKDGSL